MTQSTGIENESWTVQQRSLQGFPLGSLGRGVMALLDHAWASLGLNCKIPVSWVAETNEVGDLRVTIRIKKDRVG